MVPTLLSVTPSAGHSGGQTVLRVLGTGFQLPPSPAAQGPVPTPPPTVRVKIGGRAATDVGVVSSSELYCRAPVGDAGAARDVIVENIDADGVMIAGETVTLSAAYTFQRPDFSELSELARALEAFIIELRRQLTPNVDWAVHTDYDDSPGDGLNIAYMGKLPALVIADMDIVDNNEEPQNSYDVQIDDETFVERRAPDIVNAVMTVTGITDNAPEIFNLLQATRMFFRKNPKLVFDRDASDPSRGTLELQMGVEFGNRIRTQRQSDNTNVLWWTATVMIERITMEDLPGVSRQGVPGVPSWLPHEATVRYGWTADAVGLTVQKKAP